MKPTGTFRMTCENGMRLQWFVNTTSVSGYGAEIPGGAQIFAATYHAPNGNSDYVAFV